MELFRMLTMTSNHRVIRIVGMALLLLAFASTGQAQPPSSARGVLLVLDASGSMNERMPDGRTRFEAAQAALGDMIARLAPATRVGLRVYGHQSKPADRNCEDTELIAGFAAVEQARASLPSRVGGLQARGYTPITLSLQRAAEDIAKEPSASRVVVLSTGRGISPVLGAQNSPLWRGW
jgi:Ca-activated chloride channel homolog